MQGITSKILKNHIFFSHSLALRRKCGKRVGILCRNREYATGTCRARASPTFAKEKSKQPRRWRVLRKMLWHQSDIANGSAAADANEQASENESQRPVRFTKGVSYEAWEAERQELTRPRATDLTCMVAEVVTANHKNAYGTGVIPGRAKKSGERTKGCHALQYISWSTECPLSTQCHDKKKTGPRLTAQTCQTNY